MKNLTVLFLISTFVIFGCKNKEKITNNQVNSEASTTIEKPAEPMADAPSNEGPQKKVESMASDNVATQKQPIEYTEEPRLFRLRKASKEETRNLQRDFFTIQQAQIMGDNLKLNVQYSGGCGKTQFYPTWNGMMMKSMPPKVTLLVGFDDQDDCEALINEEIFVDLSVLKEVSDEKIMVRIAGFEEELSYQLK